MRADSTTLVDGAGSPEALDARLQQIRAEIERATHERDRDVAQERLAKPSSKLAVFRVGAASDVELGDRRRRVEGSLAAKSVAVAEGSIPSGGTALLRAARALEGIDLDGAYAVGAGIVERALSQARFGLRPTPDMTVGL